ncbi:MAG: DUF1684 domain-containing protein [Actinomycetaceae bacterium]|nr:DUF1684 domain-containing protein [Actinomycetaceae bacterium]
MSQDTATQHKDQLSRLWQKWRQERAEALREPHGWLSLTNLVWLGPEAIHIEGLPGTWASVDAPNNDAKTSTVAHRIHLSLAAGEHLSRSLPSGETAQLHGPLELDIELERGQENKVFSEGPILIELASRGGRVAVRPRDSSSPKLAGFTGLVPAYPFTPSWIVEATFHPYDEPRVMPILTAQPGLESTARAQGTVTFTIPEGGAVVELVAIGSPDGLSLNFTDETNGDTTSAWRIAPIVNTSPFDVAGGGDAGGAQVWIDFNRAKNFPAHFTAFGTCPRPVKGNHIPARVEAGELRPE